MMVVRELLQGREGRHLLEAFVVPRVESQQRATPAKFLSLACGSLWRQVCTGCSRFSAHCSRFIVRLQSISADSGASVDSGHDGHVDCSL